MKNRGFTLVEALAAIAILMLAITGPLGISGKGISAGDFSKDQLIAYHLAQEGLETVRAVRDRNSLENLPGAVPAAVPARTWLSGLDGSGGCAAGVPACNCIAPNACVVDALAPLPVAAIEPFRLRRSGQMRRRPFGIAYEIVLVRPPDLPLFAAPGQLFMAVLPHGLQQPVTPFAALLGKQDKGFVDKARQPIQH